VLTHSVVKKYTALMENHTNHSKNTANKIMK